MQKIWEKWREFAKVSEVDKKDKKLYNLTIWNYSQFLNSVYVGKHGECKIMEILEKSVMVVDYDQDEIPKQKEIPQSFDIYISNMTKQIAEKTDKRHYKSCSKDTEVVASILEIRKKL